MALLAPRSRAGNTEHRYRDVKLDGAVRRLDVERAAI